MKERLTLTLEKDVLKKVDKTIDGYKVKNRSHAIELLIVKSLGVNVPRKAIILAGGKGTRLRPITYELPKALIPIKDKTLTEHLFDLFKKYGIQDIYLAVGHKKEKIIDHFGDGHRYGIKIRYIEEDEPLGTAGPLRLGKTVLNEPFIVSNGDELKDIDIEEMFKVHKRNQALITIALTTVNDPSSYGVARLNGSQIVDFVEKPTKAAAPSNLINAGFYILEPSVIDMIGKGFQMLEKDIFPKVAKMGKLVGFPFSGQWFDTGNMKRYERAIKEWKGVK